MPPASDDPALIPPLEPAAVPTVAGTDRTVDSGARLPRLTGWIPGARDVIASRLSCAKNEPADAPPAQPLAGAQLQDVIAAAVSKALAGLPAMHGVPIAAVAMKSMADKVARLIIERGGAQLRRAANDPDLHRIGVTIAREAVIEAGYLFGGRIGGRAIEPVAAGIAERIMRALGTQPVDAAAAVRDPPGIAADGLQQQAPSPDA
jgi:hypothetical protein